ncbi:thioesterase domain-containing protein [Streptomyces sp. NPDC032472]|uniref:thioesterase II family protein n=1 Tax=Streptomyces sp. NPDC032472 TaxID=3155018 RepID=UPI0033E44AEA
MTDAARWLKRFTASASASASASAAADGGAATSRIVCFPHAGGAASAYQAWARHLPAGTELLAVQYPGRQDRLGEPCIESMAELADAVATVLAGLPELPTAVFGHSMGALVAYESVVRLARNAPRALPAHLFVSATAAPAPGAERRTLPALDDESLVAFTRRQGGTDPEVFRIPELRELLLPALRADIRLLTDYRPELPPVRLDLPLTAFGGDRDAGCPPASLSTWAGLTTGAFTSRVFPGGHFWLQGREEEPAHLVAAAVPAPAGRSRA